jgi:hypothetical protein
VTPLSYGHNDEKDNMEEIENERSDFIAVDWGGGRLFIYAVPFADSCSASFSRYCWNRWSIFRDENI